MNCDKNLFCAVFGTDLPEIVNSLSWLHCMRLVSYFHKKTHNKSPGRFIWKGLINSSKVWTRRTMRVFTVVLSGEIVLKCLNFINEKENGQGI